MTSYSVAESRLMKYHSTRTIRGLTFFMPGVGAEYRGGIKVFRPVLSGYKIFLPYFGEGYENCLENDAQKIFFQDPLFSCISEHLKRL